MRCAAEPGTVSGVDTPATGEPARFYPPRGRLLLLAAACLAVVAVFYLPASSGSPALTVIGWIGVALMATAALVLLMRAVRPGPSVVIDTEGITDRTTLAPVGLVRWQEITVIRKKEIGRGRGAERLLEVVLADPAGFFARPRGPLRRLTERYRSLLRQPLVSIPGSMVSVPMATVMDTIRTRRPELQILEGPPPAPPKFRLRHRPDPGRRHPDLPRW